jgi:hypothetical protein
MTRCTVTAIAPDGRRSTIEVEAKSRNNAVFVYNYRATDHKLIRPDFSTVFEITPAGGQTLRVTWRQVMDWANAQAPRSNRPR